MDYLLDNDQIYEALTIDLESIVINDDTDQILLHKYVGYYFELQNEFQRFIRVGDFKKCGGAAYEARLKGRINAFSKVLGDNISLVENLAIKVKRGAEVGWQEGILKIIRSLGYDPLHLPERVNGKACVKAKVRARAVVEWPNYSDGAFKKAWNILRNSDPKQIVEVAD